MNKPYYVLLLILQIAFAAVLQSCITENTDDCPPEGRHRVRVVVVPHDENYVTPGTQKIENVYIYVFDEQYNLLTLFTGGSYTYGREYEAVIDLEPGNYNFAVWTNQGEVYGNIPTYGPGDPAEKMIVSFNYPTTGIVSTDIPDLHYGQLVNAVVLPDTDNEFKIGIRPNTYRLNFTVKGLPQTPGDYSFTVTENNSHYSHDNAIIDGKDDFTYMRTGIFLNKDIIASMKVLRLADDRSPSFELSETATPASIYRNNLVEMIRAAYARDSKIPDFENVFQYDILLNFEHSLVDVEIWVNGWGYSGNETEL